MECSDLYPFVVHVYRQDIYHGELRVKARSDDEARMIYEENSVLRETIDWEFDDSDVVDVFVERDE